MCLPLIKFLIIKSVFSYRVNRPAHLTLIFKIWIFVDPHISRMSNKRCKFGPKFLDLYASIYGTSFLSCCWHFVILWMISAKKLRFQIKFCRPHLTLTRATWCLRTVPRNSLHLYAPSPQIVMMPVKLILKLSLFQADPAVHYLG